MRATLLQQWQKLLLSTRLGIIKNQKKMLGAKRTGKIHQLQHLPQVNVAYALPQISMVPGDFRSKSLTRSTPRHCCCCLSWICPPIGCWLWLEHPIALIVPFTTPAPSIPHREPQSTLIHLQFRLDSLLIVPHPLGTPYAWPNPS